MAKEFRVVDCRTLFINPDETLVTADTAEHAARLVLGEDLVRGSQGNKALRARVYSLTKDKTVTMVRLYARLGTPPQR